jgi:hypothetical protein
MRVDMPRNLIRFGLPLVIVLGQLATAGGAGAFPYQRGMVSADPTDFTPHVLNGNVNKFALVGRTMYAGGVIQTVQAQGSSEVLTRHNLMAFDAVTGAVLPFAPVVNGQVWSLLPAGDGTLFVAGAFTAVDGVPVRGLARIDLSTGRLVPGFDARLNGLVTDVQAVRGQLFVAGKFTRAGGVARSYLASLDPRTGDATPYLAVAIRGRVSDVTGGTHIYRFAVDPAATRLVMMGNFTSVAGQSRSRVAMLDLGPRAASLAVFDDIRFYEPCDVTMPAYFRDADWSPDGSYFVLVSTGLIAPGSLCDSASRWDDFTGNSGPTWINKTGGDTLHSVAVTGSAVYVGGHQRWLDNPFGRNSAGIGAVSRPGLAAINPTTGRALAWNPTRARGIGAKELYPTYVDGIRGLWIGSDTEMLGGERHGSIGFFPLT